MLKVENLTIKRQRQIILKDINFKVNAQTVTAIIGPSGIGKTTLISAICGLIKYQGNILWNDEKISHKKQMISWVPQDFGLLPWLTVKQNISLAITIKNHHKISSMQSDKLNRIAQSLSITSLYSKYPNQLSGGQKQRVALAKAFSVTPDLLLLDEPFSALDTVVKNQAQRLLLKQLKDNPVTTLIITHNLSEALIFSDQLLILSNKTGIMMTNPLNNIPADKRQDSSEYISVLTKLQKRVIALWQES